MNETSAIVRSAEFANYHLRTAENVIKDMMYQLSKTMHTYEPDSGEMREVRKEYAQIYTLVKSITDEMGDHARIDKTLFEMVENQNRGKSDDKAV